MPDVAVIGKHPDFQDNGKKQDNQRNPAEKDLFRVKDLSEGIFEKFDADHKDDKGDDQGRDVFDPAVTKGVLYIRRPVAHFGRDDGDDGGAAVGEVIKSVGNNGNTVHKKPQQKLKYK
ncbi:hypothetical protein HMPREF0322_03763 [Desulfitobacterium hafniense DP7]|uniref:Uncharacterized protein n=1 Tax=Desulfitobacterium hafniense DP7 TaxID=537010 RepID=G9XS15_DESHA|nr:hypothetical protein HMPREF0322_03763 [Desulfitobacterium hafniense DP7]